MTKTLEKHEKGNSRLSHSIRDFRKDQDSKSPTNQILILALLSSYLSILVSNFFGFSVVITNLYFFLIPAFVFTLGSFLDSRKSLSFSSKSQISPITLKSLSRSQYILLSFLSLVTCYISLVLINYLRADIAYNKGSSLAKAGSPDEGYSHLLEAASIKPNEPVYIDELSLNLGTLAASLYLQKDSSTAAQLKNEAVNLSYQVTTTHPQNVVFWKNRVRLFYTLAQGDNANEKSYLSAAQAAVEKAHLLSPNDAKISYNLGILLGQKGELEKAIAVLKHTIKLKPDYKDAYYALALFYDESGNREAAIKSLEYILKNLNPNDEQAKETLEKWK